MSKIAKAFKLADQGMSIGKAMRQVGYSPNYAKNPQSLKRTDEWQKLVAEKLPDDDLLIAHHDALGAIRHVLLDDGNMITEPDHAIRLRAAVEGYKIKGRTMENSGNSNTQINIVLGNDGYIPPNNTQGLKPTLKLKR